MLQYDGAGHNLFKEENKIDYTLRMTQFLDHYLKGAPAPKWMMEGIPAKKKGIDDGLKLVEEKDSTGNWVTPQERGLLTEEEMIRIKMLKDRKPITVILD